MDIQLIQTMLINNGIVTLPEEYVSELGKTWMIDQTIEDMFKGLDHSYLFVLNQEQGVLQYENPIDTVIEIDDSVLVVMGNTVVILDLDLEIIE